MSKDSNGNDAPTAYLLNSEISTFFAYNSTTTQPQCDERAITLVGGPVTPVPIQGSFSYTVSGGSPKRIVQFRASGSDFDIEILHLARSIHGNTIASHIHMGYIGNSKPLSIYVIELLPGVTYLEYCLEDSLEVALSPIQYERHKNIVIDFASFFAESWRNPQPTDSLPVQEKLASKLELLSQGLPPRFSELLSQLQTKLQLLFSGDYPAVLSHSDLNAMNFLVEPANGHITGIIDWADAEILPFGCGLWGFENILGFMNKEGWHYYDHHVEFQHLFWQTFETLTGQKIEIRREEIKTVRAIGIFLRYGFRWNDNLKQMVVKEANYDYLDVLLGLKPCIE